MKTDNMGIKLWVTWSAEYENDTQKPEKLWENRIIFSIAAAKLAHMAGCVITLIKLNLLSGRQKTDIIFISST